MVYTKDFKSEIALLLVVIALYFQYNTYINSFKPPPAPVIVYVKQEQPKPKPEKAAFVSQKQLNCLTEAIYYEARNQPVLGQRAVGHVILNRAKHPKFPKTVCGVINQGCQFSYKCENHSKPKESIAWTRARKIATNILSGEKDFTRGAMWYHADYVRPYWASKFNLVLNIGDHKFYRMWGSNEYNLY